MKAPGKLCAEIGVLSEIDRVEAVTFAEHEFNGADLGDARRTKRLPLIGADFLANFGSSIYASCSDPAAMAATYRALDNEHFDPVAMLEPHRCATVERVRDEKVVLVLADTTDDDKSSQPCTDGLGFLNTTYSKGLFVQPALVVTPERLPLGLLEVQMWTRESLGIRKKCGSKPIAAKESRKWLTSLDTGNRLATDVESTTKVICIFDREGDIFDVLHHALQPSMKCGFIVRSLHNRKLEESERLWDRVGNTRCLGILEVDLPKTEKSQGRTARLEIRADRVTLNPPSKRPKGAGPVGPVDITAVLVQEIDAPKDVDAIVWKLLTSEVVDGFESACQIVKWYSCRWVIEVFFRIAKTGCGIEKRQLETVDRLRRCLIIDLVVTWIVHYLTMLGRIHPNLPCTKIFQDDEWQPVWRTVNADKPIPREPPTLALMIRLIGRLGGHKGRKTDGLVGPGALWRGLARMRDLSHGWRAALSRQTLSREPTERTETPHERKARTPGRG